MLASSVTYKIFSVLLCVRANSVTCHVPDLWYVVNTLQCIFFFDLQSNKKYRLVTMADLKDEEIDIGSLVQGRYQNKW